MTDFNIGSSGPFGLLGWGGFGNSAAPGRSPGPWRTGYEFPTVDAPGIPGENRLPSGGGRSTSWWDRLGDVISSPAARAIATYAGGLYANSQRLKQLQAANEVAAAGVIPPWLITGAAGAAGSLITAGAGALSDYLGGGSMANEMVVSSTPGVFAGGPLDVFRTGFYRASGRGYSPIRLLPVQTPSGGISYWRHVGRPIAFSGDRGLSRRLAKVARQLGGATRARPKSRRRR